jgi:hypothetical protein
MHACMHPTPPLSCAPPPRGLLCSASCHLAHLDRCKRQAVQLRVSFTLASPAASLARPCPIAAQSTLCTHVQAPAIAHFALAQATIRTPPPVTYCPCPHRCLPPVRAGQPRHPYPVFPLLVAADDNPPSGSPFSASRSWNIPGARRSLQGRWCHASSMGAHPRRSHTAAATSSQ